MSDVWLTHDQALARLDVGKQALRKAMAEGQKAAKKVGGDEGERYLAPVNNIGSDKRPKWRWRIDRIDDWFELVGKWRQSPRGGKSGSSAGETRTKPSGTKPARPETQPESSSERSSTSTRSAAAGLPRMDGLIPRSSSGKRRTG